MRIRRSTRIAAFAAAASLTLAACATDEDVAETDDTADVEDDGAMDDEAMDDETMDDEAMDDEAGDEMAALPTGEFGPGCELIPSDPDDPGSSEGMAQDPVATAASNNPLLTTLVDLVGQAGLVDTLNGLDGATIFAPTDDAFAALQADDPDTFEAVANDVDLLTTVLSYHVVADQELDAQGLADTGTVTTFAEQDLSVTADGETVTVEGAGSDATVVCGNVETANATVHVIDYVLVPDVG